MYQEMQQSSNPITDKLITLDIENLRLYLNGKTQQKTIAQLFDKIQLREQLIEVCGLLKLSKQQVQQLEKMLQNCEVDIESKLRLMKMKQELNHIEQINQIVIQLRNEHTNEINEMNLKLAKLTDLNNQMVNEFYQNANNLILKQIECPNLPQNIVQIDENMKSKVIKDLESQYKQLFEANQQFQQKLNITMEQQKQNKNEANFIQFQSKPDKSRVYDQLKQDYQEIVTKAQLFSEKIQKKHDETQNQETKTILQQMFTFLQNHLKIIEKSLQKFDELRREYEDVHSQTEELLKKNKQVTKALEQQTKEYATKIHDLQQQFETAKNNFNSYSVDLSLQANYSKTQIEVLSQESLRIHEKFYQRIVTNLPELITTFVNSQIRNVLGNYLASRDGLMMNLQNKQDLIQGTQDFLEKIKPGQNNNFDELLDISAKFLENFKNFFPTAQGDKQQNCFTQSYNNCQLALTNFQKYLQSISNGVQEFQLDHAHLLSLEKEMK